MKLSCSTTSRIALLVIASSVLSLSACTSSPDTKPSTASSEAATSPTVAASTTGSAPGTQSGTADPLKPDSANSKSGASPLDLVENPQVQKELNLKPQQISELKKNSQKLRQLVGQTISSVNWTELKTDKAKQKDLEGKVFAMTSQASNDMQKILEPQQRQRFKQISLQIYGFGALSYDQFAKDLNLTSDQQTKLNNLRQDTFQKIRVNLEPPENNSQEALGRARDINQKRVEEILNVSNQQAQAILTDQQKSKLETLKGKQFTLG